MPSRKATLRKIRQAWGYPRPDDASFVMIGAYSEQQTAESWHRLSEQTQSDIDFREVFRVVDHTNSRIGQQYLYDRLLHPHGDAGPLRRLDEQARYFAGQTQQREKVQIELATLDHPDAYFLHLLMTGRLFKRPRWYPLLILDSCLVLLMLLLAPFYPVLLIWLLLPFGVNLMLHFWNKKNTYSFVRSFTPLNRLIKATRNLLAEDLPVDRSGVSESLQGLKGYRRRSVWLSFGQTAGSEMAMLYYWGLELLKSVFLVEVHSFFGLIRELEQRANDIRRLFVFVGAIDMAISVASFRAGGSPTCLPSFRPLPAPFLVRDVYHPLIPDCIVNSLDVGIKGVLITGSNMSGKTTFLRTLGINSLLAQTICTCCAAEYCAPLLRLYSSIRIDDSVLDGKSYYLEEVHIMGELIAAAEKVGVNLYLLDEVFKGTNTVERIASAKAILSWLNRKGHLVVVSTHDLELSGLLKDRYDLYHFEDQVVDGNLLFDHLIKTGPLTTRNAIRILELSGYPLELIRDARDGSQQSN